MRETPTSIILNLCRHGGDEATITWAEVEKITAFKQDLFNPQIVILELRTADATWEVDAVDCAGFETFSHLLVRRLPGMMPYTSWWQLVTDPLGRQEDVVLYARPGA